MALILTLNVANDTAQYQSDKKYHVHHIHRFQSKNKSTDDNSNIFKSNIYTVTIKEKKSLQDHYQNKN